MLDREAPSEPRDLAGVVAADGLTLRWIPGTDASGQLGHLVLYVNGEPYRNFDQTQFEAKLGPFAADDTRRFTLVQVDAAGNRSRQTASSPRGAAGDGQEPRQRRRPRSQLQASSSAGYSSSRPQPSCPARSSARPT